MQDTYAIVGAGFTGAILARQLAEAGRKSVVFDKRPHVAGNCHTERDADTGIMVHKYGPHIFHTDDGEVWEFIQKFGTMVPYTNRVKATVNGQVFSLPINLHTINQFFGRAMRPDEARAFIGGQTNVGPAENFETSARNVVGDDLYQAFLEGYTAKQWGRPPRDIPASVAKRLPVRFDYDDDYFPDRFQGMPRDGYTSIVSALLDHPNITLRLSATFDASETNDWKHVFWTGRIDEYFAYSHGPLGYRTTDFVKTREKGDFQGCAVMNHPDKDVPHVRSTEFKHFTPWETHTDTIVYHEYPRECGATDEPMYPIRTTRDKERLAKYIQQAQSADNVTFAGRLGTYRYLDMDDAIREAMDLAQHVTTHAIAPRFSAHPLS